MRIKISSGKVTNEVFELQLLYNTGNCKYLREETKVQPFLSQAFHFPAIQIGEVPKDDLLSVET